MDISFSYIRPEKGSSSPGQTNYEPDPQLPGNAGTQVRRFGGRNRPLPGTNVRQDGARGERVPPPSILRQEIPGQSQNN